LSFVVFGVCTPSERRTERCGSIIPGHAQGTGYTAPSTGGALALALVPNTSADLGVVSVLDGAMTVTPLKPLDGCVIGPLLSFSAKKRRAFSRVSARLLASWCLARFQREQHQPKPDEL